MEPCLPLRDIAREIKGLPACISGLEVFNAYLSIFGEQPRRGVLGLRVYTRKELERVLETSCIDREELLELEEWRLLVPLSGCKTRTRAMVKLAKMGEDGWLQRCSYKYGQLLLPKQDAERLCYSPKTGRFALPMRWKVPTVLGRDELIQSRA